MKSIVKISVIFLVTLLLVGWDWGKTPRCSDATVQATVIQIVREEMLKKLQELKAEATMPIPDLEAEWMDAIKRVKLDAIRTRFVDPITGNCDCAATITVQGSESEPPIPIIYIVERGDDGELYVTVYGL